MKLLYTVFFLVLCVNYAFGQSYKNAFRADMCNCLKDESLKRTLTENVLKACFKETLPKYAAQIDAQIIEEDLNKKYMQGQIARKDVLLALQYELVYTCDVYYDYLEREKLSKKLIARENIRENALETKNQYVAMSPNAYAYFSRAELYYNLGLLKEAEADLKKSLELNPNSQNANATRRELVLLAFIYEDNELYAEAISLYDTLYLGDYDTQIAILRALVDRKRGGTLSNMSNVNEKKVLGVSANSRNRRQQATSRSTTKTVQKQVQTKIEKSKAKKETDTSSLKKLFKIDN